MALRKTAAVLAVCAACAAAGDDFDIVINEINYHSVHGAGRVPAELAWVELYNRGAAPIDLSGWSFSEGVAFTFPAGSAAPAGGFVLVCGNRAACAAAWPDEAWMGDFGLHLAKGGERLTLVNGRGFVVDSVFFSDSRPWPDRADGGGATLELVDPDRDNDEVTSWSSSLVVGGTPGLPNSVLAREVVVLGRHASWSFWRGASAPPGGDGAWIEPAYDDAQWERGESPLGYGTGLYLLTTLADMRDGYSTVFARAAFDLPADAAFSQLRMLADFDDGFVAYLNGKEVARVLIAGPGVPGQTAVASAAHRSQTPCELRIPVDAVRPGRNVLAVVGANQSAASSTFLLDVSLTGVLPRPAAVSEALAINEVGPETGGAWVELINESSEAVALDGYAVGADMRVSTALVGRIEAGAVSVVSLGSLPEAGTLMLTRGAERRLVSQLKYRLIEGESWGRYYSGGKGYFTAPTRGRANGERPPRQIVVSEVNYHPAGEDDRDEFIELRNAGAAPVDLSDWRFESGIAYVFPQGTVLDAGAALLLVPDAAHAAAAHPGVVVLGDYVGRLSDKSERVQLVDARGREIVDFHYADDGAWPRQADGPSQDPDPNNPDDTGGAGMTLELLDARLDPDSGGAWTAETVGGTPGRGRAQAGGGEAPVVYECELDPPLAPVGQPMVCTARVRCPAGVASVTLRWRYSADADWQTLALADDGAHGDGAPGDAWWGGALTAADHAGTIAWHIACVSASGDRSAWPRGAPDKYFRARVDARPFLPDVTGNFAYVLMDDADLTELRTREVTSNVLLRCSLLKDGRAYQYGLVRYRGSSARGADPRSYRIELTHDETRPNAKNLYFNAVEPWRQYMGMTTSTLAGIPSPQVRFFALAMDDGFWTSYVNVERIDEFFITRHMPGDDGGNVYRATRCTELADLDYRGEDQDQYTCSYDKITNQDARDWSDIVRLCAALNAPDEDYLAGVGAVLDVDQWCRYFAVQTVLANQETTIYNDWGDDYFLYARPSDGKFILLPWDMDSTYRENAAEERLFRPELPAVKRFLRHLAQAPRFWQHLEELVDRSFGGGGVSGELERLPRWVTRTTLASFSAYRERRVDYIRSQMALGLRACGHVLGDGPAIVDLVPRGDTWRFFRGTRDPAAGLQWAATDFDDGTWEQGAAGFGYADDDDTTVLEDMEDGYGTLYVRHAFDLARPEDIATQLLWVNYDDGFVCYLNGQEIARENAGSAGEVLAHDAVADGSHEQGTAATYDMSGFVGRARTGKNMLALIGLNNDVGSSDFSLHPALIARQGGVPETPGGCGSPLVVPEGSPLRLDGAAPVVATSYVEVNDAPVSYDILTGAWSVTLQEVPASIRVVARTFARDAAATLDLAVLTRTPVVLKGALASRVLAAQGGPYVFDSASVDAGAVVTIEAGAECLLSSSRALVVRGELGVTGTQAAPVLLRRGVESLDAGIVVEGGKALLRWVEVVDATRNPGVRLPTDPATPLPVNACRVAGGELTLEDCVVRGCGAPCVSVAQGTLRATRCRFADSAGGIVGDNATIELRTCRFETLGPEDGVRQRNGGTLLAEECAFVGIGKHGIDTTAPATIAKCSLQHIGARALSLAGAVDHQVTLTLVAWARTGVSVRSGARATLDHLTCAANGLGLEIGSWGGGATSAALRDGIVWDNAGAFTLQGNGALSVATTLFQDAALAAAGGNLCVDPRFVDAAAGDWRIDSQSPARNRASDGTDLGALPRPTVSVLVGDLNRDTRVNIADVIFLLGYLFAHAEAPWCLELADINGDGRNNIADPIHLLSYLFAKGPPPVTPSTGCEE